MRKTFGVLFAAVLMMSAVAITATAASGAAATPTCKSAKGTFKFSPGLPVKGTIKGGKLTSSGPITGCSGGGVTSGKASFTSAKSTTASGCSTLTKPDPKSKGTLGAFTIKWNNGKTSTAKTFYIKQTKAIVDATTIGKITSGLFVGKTIKGTITFALAKGSCSTKPATGGTYVAKKGTTFTVK
jgi:hypothetical protein